MLSRDFSASLYENEEYVDPIDYTENKITDWKYYPSQRWIWAVVKSKNILGFDSSEPGKFSIEETDVPNVWILTPVDPNDKTRALISIGDDTIGKTGFSDLAQKISINFLKRLGAGPFDVLPSLYLKNTIDKEAFSRDFPNVDFKTLVSGTGDWRKQANRTLGRNPADLWKYFPNSNPLFMIHPFYYNEDGRKRWPGVEGLVFHIPAPK